MTPALYDALLDLLVRRLDGPVPGAELVDWATSALQEGVEPHSLVILAGLSSEYSMHEAAPLLDRGLAELNFQVPAGEALRRAYVGVVSRAILAESVAADDALDRIHRRVVTPLGHPPDLAPWCFVGRPASRRLSNPGAGNGGRRSSPAGDSMGVASTNPWGRGGLTVVVGSCRSTRYSLSAEALPDA